MRYQTLGVDNCSTRQFLTNEKPETSNTSNIWRHIYGSILMDMNIQLYMSTVQKKSRYLILTEEIAYLGK